MASDQEISLFQVLVQQRGLGEYLVFLKQLQTAAAEVARLEHNPALAKVTIGERQFSRWTRGQHGSGPRPLTARVLEHLFQRSARDLFGPARAAGERSSRLPAAQCIEPGASSDAHTRDLLMTAASESASFAAYAEQSNVGPHSLEQLSADIRRIVSTYPNRPVVPLFEEVLSLRDRCFELLEGRQPPAYTSDLYLAASVLCGILANASFDLGAYREAETQARTAFVCAEQAGHNGLRSWIRGTQALICYWEERPHDAIRLVKSGEQYVPENGTAHIRLASIAARAHARLGQEHDAVAALRRADEYREQAADDDIPGGMLAFPLAKQRFYAATTRLWLGGDANNREAAALAEEAVALYESAPPENQRLGELSLARMDLALAELAGDEIEGAAHQIDAVIAVASRRPTESVSRRLGQFARRLAASPAGTSAIGLSLQDGIMQHRRARNELPAGGRG
ncbi:hypothetical protein [Kitasatospora sp. NPDC058162]|uniref:hypothetical protein n=1 Tax=unclassified Kitasatospora TaxID=2633591 RepID=UPI0036DCFE1C